MRRAARWKADCPRLRMSLAAHFASLGESLELEQHVNAFYTISCYLVFHVQPCQMTPSPKRSITQQMTEIRAGVPPICAR